MAITGPFSTPLDAFDSVEQFMSRWPNVLSWPVMGWGDGSVGVLYVDEYREGNALVVRAELPGIDPDNDLEVTASKGNLHIAVECHEEEAPMGRQYLRHELTHRRRLVRDLTLPELVQDAVFTATYTNGILDIRIPLPTEAITPTSTKIPITKS